MFDLTVGTCCGSSCLVPPPDFRGSFWGVVKDKITRLSDSIHFESELAPPEGDLYPWPNRQAHPRLFRQLPTLTDSNGVTRECLGAACTKIADSAPLQSTINSSCDQHLWCWLHYVPVGETDLDNAMAALAVARVGDYSYLDEGPKQAFIDEPQVWLLEDRVWDDRQWLDCHYDHRKCCVGPDHIAWIDKRFVYDDDPEEISYFRVHYYNRGSSTLNFVEAKDPTDHQEGTEFVYDFPACDASSMSFPMGLGCLSFRKHFGDGTVERVEWDMRAGVINLGTLKVEAPPSVPPEEVAFWEEGFVLPSNLLKQRMYRTSTAAPELSEGWLRRPIKDWECYAGFGLYNAGENATGTPYLTDAAIVNDCGSPPFAMDAVLTPSSNLTTWVDQQRRTWLVANIGAGQKYIENSTGYVHVGSSSSGAHGPVRLFVSPSQHYAANDEQGSATPFCCVGSPPDEGDPGSFGPAFLFASAQVGGSGETYNSESLYAGITTSFVYSTINSRVLDEDNQLMQFQAIRISAMANNHTFAYEANEPTAPTHTRFVASGVMAEYTFEDSVFRYNNWTLALHADKTSTLTDFQLYPHRLMAGSPPAGESIFIDPPRGFYKDAETGNIGRGRFAIACMLDTAHPTVRNIWDDESSYPATDEFTTYSLAEQVALFG